MLGNVSKGRVQGNGGSTPRREQQQEKLHICVHVHVVRCTLYVNCTPDCTLYMCMCFCVFCDYCDFGPMVS